jgi:fluoride exporter
VLLVWIAFGGALGGMARYGIDVAANFSPLATLLINVLGSLAIGVLLPWLIRSGDRARLVPFVITGMLGGFTTFSAFAADAVELLAAGLPFLALGYVALTLVAGIGAVMLGQRLVRQP